MHPVQYINIVLRGIFQRIYMCLILEGETKNKAKQACPLHPKRERERELSLIHISEPTRLA